MNLQAVSTTTFAPLRWRRPADWRFAAHEWRLPLGMAELAPAVLSYPIAFARQGTALLPYALVSLVEGQNWWVAPDGQWRAGHLPAILRAYPFRLAHAESGDRVLAVDMDSGLVGGDTGEPFFDGDTLTPALQEISGQLVQAEQGHLQAAQACAALEAHGVIVPWPLTVRAPEGERRLEGLFKVDEAALARVALPALDAIRRAGGLPLAYCQMLSMQQVPLLGRMAEQPASPAPEPTVQWPEFGGTISFANLG